MDKAKIPFKKGDIAKLYNKLIVIESLNLLETGTQVVFKFYNVNHERLYFTDLHLITPLNQKIVKILYTK